MAQIEFHLHALRRRNKPVFPRKRGKIQIVCKNILIKILHIPHDVYQVVQIKIQRDSIVCHHILHGIVERVAAAHRKA